MTPSVIAVSLAVGIAVHAAAHAQNMVGAGSSSSPSSIVLVDSTGKTAARPLSDTVVLVAVSRGIDAPASIGPIYDADGRTASGLATWRSGGSVLFTSTDCTTGAHVYSLPLAGVRAAAQVQTPAGIVLYAGAIGTATTVDVRSVLYETGCSPLAVRQNGLLPVQATVNLSTAYPPPLSFQ